MSTYSITNPPTKVVECDDRVTFVVDGTTFDYRVDTAGRNPYLYYPCGPNETIFNVLDLDKTKFCAEAYGYEPVCGDCPEARDGDFAAVTKLIFKLFAAIATQPQVKRTKLSTESYFGGLIKVTLEQVGDTVELLVENADDPKVCIATLTTKDNKDGKAYLKLAELSDEELDDNGLARATTGSTIALQ